MTETIKPSIGMCAQAACILDVACYKPGNVRLGCDFDDMTAIDFLISAAAIAPVLEQAPFRSVGATILDCIKETRKVTTANTNLGIVLLLAPLATVQPHLDLRGGLMRVLMRLNVADSRAAYEAIRLAKPGGLGSVPDQDVANEPTVTLREAMGLAADRDLIARQYVNDFEQVFEGVELLREHVPFSDADFQSPVTRLFLQLLANYPDSLIERKFGRPAAEEVSRKAREIVHSEAGYDQTAIGRFDHWLRRRDVGPRNPGTTADLVTACLFVVLRQNIIQLPFPCPTTHPTDG